MTARAATGVSQAAKLSYTINEAAAAIGISRSKLYELIGSGEVAAFKWAGRTLIHADDLRTAVDRASGRRAA